MITNIKLLNAIDSFVDTDEMAELARNTASACDGSIRDSQLRSLQNITNSTSRFSEIINFIKSQTGKTKKRNGQVQGWGKLGPEALLSLEVIKQKGQELAAQFDADEREIRLSLARHWVKMVLAEFLYGKAARGAK